MTEVSKAFRIVIFAGGIMDILIGIMYLFFTDTFYALSGSPWYDPVFTSLSGVMLICIGSFVILAAIRAEWDQIRILIELGIVLLISITVLNLVHVFDPAFADVINSSLLGAALTGGFGALFLIFYLKERPKS